MMDLEAQVPRAVSGDRAAIEALISGLRDDVYHLALRMLGLRADAEDATQEILLQTLTHLAQFRGDSKLRTWVWQIAQRHLMRYRKTARESAASFENIEGMIAAGDSGVPQLEVGDTQLKVLAEEVRLACTGAMVLSLDRPHRIAWILTEIFELSSNEAAEVLEIDAATYRKRVQRSRERLAEWMKGHCGLVDEAHACRCKRQIPVANAAGVARLDDLQYANHPGSPRAPTPLDREADELERTAAVLKAHPQYTAPASVTEHVRELIDSGKFRLFDA